MPSGTIKFTMDASLRAKVARWLTSNVKYADLKFDGFVVKCQLPRCRKRIKVDHKHGKGRLDEHINTKTHIRAMMDCPSQAGIIESHIMRLNIPLENLRDTRLVNFIQQHTGKRNAPGRNTSQLESDNSDCIYIDDDGEDELRGNETQYAIGPEADVPPTTPQDVDNAEYDDPVNQEIETHDKKQAQIFQENGVEFERTDRKPSKEYSEEEEDEKHSKNLEQKTNLRDDFNIFGEYVASKLRKLRTEYAQNAAEHLISHILWEAANGKYDNSYSCVPPQFNMPEFSAVISRNTSMSCEPTLTSASTDAFTMTKNFQS